MKNLVFPVFGFTCKKTAYCLWSYVGDFAIFGNPFTNGFLNEIVLPHKRNIACIKFFFFFFIHEYRNELSIMFNSLKHAWTWVLSSWWTIKHCFFAEADRIAVIPGSSGFLLILAIPRDGGRTVKVPFWFSYYVTFVHWLKGEQLIQATSENGVLSLSVTEKISVFIFAPFSSLHLILASTGLIAGVGG